MYLIKYKDPKHCSLAAKSSFHSTSVCWQLQVSKAGPNLGKILDPYLPVSPYRPYSTENKRCASQGKLNYDGEDILNLRYWVPRSRMIHGGKCTLARMSSLQKLIIAIFLSRNCSCSVLCWRCLAIKPVVSNIWFIRIP